MSDETQPGKTFAEPLSGPPPPDRVTRIFFGEQGLRFGWGVVVFVALYLLLDAGMSALLSLFVSLRPANPLPPAWVLLRESGEVLVVLCATWWIGLLEGRSVASYGYGAAGTFSRLFTGALWGFACLSVLVGLLWKCGFLVFEGRALHGVAAWKYALAWALAFLLVGLFEESLVRGYLQFTLARGVGFWWAAVLLSLLFGLLHQANSGESPLGLLSAATGGFVFCLSLWYTKSLWWAIGFHAGWDWSQSYFYGTADSGLVVQGHLFAVHPAGPVLWSGGTVGPEGSLLQFPLLILLVLGMWLWWGRLARKSRTERGVPGREESPRG